MQTPPRKRPAPLIEVLITVLLPAVILMQWSDPERLGAVQALVLALSFPLGYGGWDLVRHRHVSYLALLGLLSVLLTGGIGLLKLEVKWLAIKEAAIPALIGLGVLITGVDSIPLGEKTAVQSAHNGHRQNTATAGPGTQVGAV